MRPKLTRAGRALLLKAVAAIKKHPEAFHMGDFMRHEGTVKARKPYCGTVACLAGHIVLAAGAPPVNRDSYRLSELPRALRAAGKAARICGERRIFIEDLAEQLVLGRVGGPVSLTPVFYATQLETPEELALRVRDWLRTGE